MAYSPCTQMAPLWKHKGKGTIEEGERMEYREACVGLSELFGRNPAYGDVYAAAIEACDSQIGEAAAVEAVEAAKTSHAQTQSGQAILATLIRRGGIERTIIVDGEPYEGTLQDLQADETLGDDIEIEFFVEATDAGIDSAMAYRDSKSLENLFVQLPEHRDGFIEAIKACSASQGAATDDVQQALIQAGIIQPGIASAQVIHASYFTSKLERYGALVWEGKRWHATEKGLACVGASEEGK